MRARWWKGRWMARGGKLAARSAHRSRRTLPPRRALLRPKPLYATTEGLTWLVAGWTPDTVEKLIARGVLRLNEHYVQPFGDQRLFIVSKVEAAIEKGLADISANVVEARPPTAVVEVVPTVIPMAKGRVLDATDPKAAAEEWVQSRQPGGEAALPISRRRKAEVARHET